MSGVEVVEGSEAIGLGVALVVLLIAFGSVIAAGIPIGSAVFGIFVGLGLIGVMSGFTGVPSISPMLASMIGIGVGIDYAFFVVTRHRAYVAAGRSPVEAAAPFGFADRWRALFPGARQKTVENGNHFPMCDDPAGFVAELVDWHRLEVAK